MPKAFARPTVTIDWDRSIAGSVWTADGVTDGGSWKATVSRDRNGPFGTIYWYEVTFADGERSAGGSPSLQASQESVREFVDKITDKARRQATTFLAAIQGRR